ncbi:MAG: alpha-amylase, partial [Bacteroidia bacterium]|nr:alpha-amylase [Bacteroidia bacterium]
MKSVCLFFQVHQPFRHRHYRFFDIGNDHYYYDDYSNETIMRRIAEKCYLPTNQLLLKLADQMEGKFKVAFSITGLALEQFELYAPEVIESFQKLAKTGCVEFLSETYSHSLASLTDWNIFKKQVQLHDQLIFRLFGQQPQVFRNTEMIYSDQIGAQIAEMGFQAMLTEGARHVLGWKSPNFLYVNAINPRLKILMRNFKLSDDISFRFSNTNWSEYPLTADKFVSWLEKLDKKEEVVNLFLSYESFGERQPK